MIHLIMVSWRFDSCLIKCFDFIQRDDYYLILFFEVEALADTIHLAADTAKVADGINACNYARAGALEAYANVNRIVNGLGGVVGSTCGCVQGACVAQAIPESCGYPHEGYQALLSQADQLWQAVKATTLRCKIIGDASVLASN